MFKCIVLLVIIFNQCWAGNGSSGGGNIYSDQINPWFMQNTSTIRYCITISPDFSNLSQAKIHKLVEEAFAFWKNEFNEEKAFSILLSPVPVLGSQEIIYGECDSNTDLRFQLGIISEEQKKGLYNFQTVIATAYRESYDQVNLKGKGFIYVAPQSGSLRPKSDAMIEHPWDNVRHDTLLLTLIHELGHIYGLQDDHKVPDRELMSASFVENMTSREPFTASLESMAPLGTMAEFFYGTTLTPTRYKKELASFLGITTKNEITLQGEGDRVVLTSEEGVVGTLKLTKKHNGINVVNALLSDKIRIWLPEEQKVFTPRFEESIQGVYISLMNTLSSFTLANQTFERADGTQVKVDCHFLGDGDISVSAVVNGKIHYDILNTPEITHSK